MEKLLKSLITLLVLGLSTTSFAKTKPDADGCYYIKVCPTVKKHKKAVAAAVVVVPVIPVCPPLLAPVIIAAVPPGCPEHKFIVGGHLSLGLGVQNPYVSGRVGLRFEIPKAYLGLDLFSMFQYGVGAQLLPYVYRGKRVAIHVVDPGFLVTGSPFDYWSDKDVHRRIDILAGVGAEIKLTCHLAALVDYRVDIPGKFGSCDRCVDGKKLDVQREIGNAFAASQVFVGLMVFQVKILSWTLKLAFFASYLFLVAKVYRLLQFQTVEQIGMAQQEAAMASNAYGSCMDEKKTIVSYLDYVLMALDDTIDRANACEDKSRKQNMAPSKGLKPKHHLKQQSLGYERISRTSKK